MTPEAGAPSAPLLHRSEPLDAPLSEQGRLQAAARLDALGVEVLCAAEAAGWRERDLRLTYRVGLRFRGREDLACDFADLATLRRQAEAAFGAGNAAACRIVTIICAAWLRT